MDINFVKLKCLQRFDFENRTYFPGESVYQIRRVADRWVSRGLAEYGDPDGITPDYLEHPGVSIIILVKNALDYVKECIDSIIKYTDNFELVIVDNDSDEKTKEYLKSINCFDYTLITNSENMGVSYGWNQALKIAKYDYICLMNSDCIVTPYWLNKLVRGFKYNDKIGIVGPSSNGGPTVWGPQVTGPIEKENINKFAKTLPDDFIEAPVVGFCFIIAKKVFDKIGGFDYKRYDLACYEDIDFSWRASKAGFKSLWCRGSYVYHYGNKTMKEMGLDVQEIRNLNEPIMKARFKDSNLYIENDVEVGNVEVISKNNYKIGFVTYQNSFKGSEPASTRIRVTWPLKYLNGIISEKYDELVNCSTVVFQTRYDTNDIILANNLKRLGVKLIADFTDPHWLLEYNKMDSNFLDMVALADIVTLPTQGLVNSFDTFFKKKTFIVKDRLELGLYPGIKIHKDKKNYIILWHGSFGNLGSLELAREDLEKLGLEFDLTLICIYDMTDKHSIKPFKNIKFKTIEWTNQTVIDELLKSDISINPRYDNWKSYKSNNKTITAWACGIPCIEKDFYNEIKKYLSSADLRNQEAKINRAIVEKDYNVKLTATEWEKCAGVVHWQNTVKAEAEEFESLPPATKKNITVYTSICGNRDILREDQAIGNANYIAFMDNSVESKIWDIKNIYHQFIDPSREAKIFKVLPWQYIDTEYSIWIDGSIAIKCDPEYLIKEFLKNSDIALFKHAARDDIYEEYEADFRHRTNEPIYLREKQREKYLKEGFPKHSGLFECGVILRRHTEPVKRLCETWWAEICAFTVSDQCSFIYSVLKHNIKVNTLPESIWKNSYFHLIPHGKGAKIG